MNIVGVKVGNNSPFVLSYLGLFLSSINSGSSTK